MGTYTTNYQLYMPSIGEQGWGELINGNFTTIDTTMKGLDARVGTLETDMDAVEERVTTLEAGNFEIVTSEELVSGIGNFSTIHTNKIDGMSYIELKGILTETNTGLVYAKCQDTALPITSTVQTLTITGYTTAPVKIADGIYITNVEGEIPQITTRNVYLKHNSSWAADFHTTFYYKKSNESGYNSVLTQGTGTYNVTLDVGETYNYYFGGYLSALTTTLQGFTPSILYAQLATP